ncbi:MAG: hypothetical protein K8S98_07515 [Planctomycetes bacterium]|nr:hypothetical protein [Planctomycetota bacterium]
MKRLVLVLAVAVLALLAFVLRSKTSRHDVASNSVATAESSDDSRENSLATVETEAQRQANGAPTNATSVSTPNELLIEVVDAQTQAPVSGAQVVIAGEELEREYTSDELGHVRVPPTTSDVTISSSLGRRRGEVEIDAGATSARIELVAYVAVEVTDRAGRPVAGVEVAVLATDLGEWVSSRGVSTDARGRVEIRCVDKRVTDPTTPLRIATTWVACTPEFHEFTLATLRDEVVHLVIEDTGSVEITATDSRGTPLETQAAVYLRVDRRSREARPFALAARAQLWASTSHGVARFDHVGLGLALVAVGSASGVEFTERFFRGPRTPDEVVRVTVPIDKLLPAIRARLLDSDGKPLAKRLCEMWTDGPTSDGVPYWLPGSGWTDDQGTLHAYLSSPPPPNELLDQLQVRVRNPATRGLLGRASWPQKIETGEGLPRDEYDFGDVVCTADPFYCAGVVIDANDARVVGAKIRSSYQGSDGQPVRGVPTCTDVDGRFELGAPATVNEMTVDATGKNCMPSDVQIVTRGVHDLVLRLRPAEVLFEAKGTWIAQDGVTIDEGELVLESEFGGERHWCSSDWSTAHQFSAKLEAGVHTLIVSFDDEEVARIEGVEIKANETNELAPIDLRSRIHALTFRVVDENGAPLRDGTINVLRGGEFLRDAPLGADGRATLPSLTTIVDVVASAAGRRSRLFAGVENGATLELPRGIRADLRAPSLGDADLALVVELAYCGADPAAAYSDSFAIAFDGERASAEIPIAGDYCVVDAALVQRKSGARFELEAADVTLVTLVEAPAESVLSLPADALAAALRAATGR